MNLFYKIFGYQKNKEYWIPVNEVIIPYDF